VKRLIPLLMVLMLACGSIDSTAESKIAPQAQIQGRTSMATVSAQEPATFGLSWSTAPDDGVNAKGADVRELAELALTNDKYLSERGVVSVNQYQWVEIAFGTIASKVDSGLGYPTEAGGVDPIQVDVPDTVAGSILLIDVSAYVRSETSGGNTGLIGVRVIEDSGGADTPVDTVGAFGGWDADNVRRKESLAARHVITTPGTARVRLRLGGPAATKHSYVEGYLTIRVQHVRTLTP
jgi:hypothetical protein